MRIPKILLPISNVRHFSRTFLFSLVILTYITYLTSPHLAFLSTYLPIYYSFTHGRQLPQHTHIADANVTGVCICVCACALRATENVRACLFVVPLPLLILAPRPAPTDVHPHLHPQPASASSFSICIWRRICICICILDALAWSALAAAAPPPPQYPNASTGLFYFHSLEAKYFLGGPPIGTVSLSRVSRAIDNLGQYCTATCCITQPSQPAASAHEYSTMLSKAHSLPFLLQLAFLARC